MLFRFGATFRSVDEEEMPTDDSCVHVHEQDEKDLDILNVISLTVCSHSLQKIILLVLSIH